MTYHRYAVYYRPKGDLANFGADWLGWDPATGKTRRAAPVPVLEGAQEVLTATPRKYGLHATLKPPFRLAEGVAEADLEATVADLAAALAPARCDGLAVTGLGSFLALTPEGDASGLGRVAGACVTKLDACRAPLTEAELAKRRKSRLSKRQEAHLLAYGYPYVLEDFRFHITLTGPISGGLETVQAVLAEALHGLRPRPFLLDEITLLGEDDQGRFHDLHRYTLTG